MPSCPIHPSEILKPMRRGWHCEECDGIVAPPDDPRAGPSGFGDLDLAHLPFPVAYPLMFARGEDQAPADRLDNTIFAAYQAMRTTALLLLSDYLAIDQCDAAVNRAIRGLRQPHWGEWSGLCKVLCVFWAKRRGEGPMRETHFEALARGWRAVSDDQADPGPLLQGIAGQHGPAKSANDAIWNLRNVRAHRLGTRTAGRVDNDAKTLIWALPLVEQMCNALFPAGAFRLVRRVAEGPLQVIDLHGPHPGLTFEPTEEDAVWSGVFAETGVAALVGVRGISVYPFFAPEPDPFRSPGEGVTLVDGIRAHQVILQGVQSWCLSEIHIAPLTAALARKQLTDFGLKRDDIKRWSLADWSRATARDVVGDLRGCKYFPASYVERIGVDDRADSVAACGGRALLILGEAGSGKSSLLVRMVERLVSERGTGEPGPGEAPPLPRQDGDDVLFLAGRAAYGEAGSDSLTATELLVEMLARQAGLKAGQFKSMKLLLAHLQASVSEDTHPERLLWIILDGLNEADRFADLVKAVDDLLPQVPKYPWLRLVVTMRKGAYSMLERRNAREHRQGGVFANERHLALFFDDAQKKEVPYLEVRAFKLAIEGPRAYAKRAAALEKPGCGVPWTSLPRSVQELLLSPLHLHLFHEAYSRVDHVRADLDVGGLLGAYLERICDEHQGLRTTLEQTAAEMLRRHQPALPVDVVDRWLDHDRRVFDGAPAARLARLDPIEELVSASVLMRPAREGVGQSKTLTFFTFCHQRMCEEVLARELLRGVNQRPTAKDLARWAGEAAAHPEFAELLGALRSIVGRAAVVGDGEMVASLLAFGHDGVRDDLLGAAVQRLGLAWGQTETGEAGPATTLAALQQAATRDGARARFATGSDVSWWLGRRGATFAALAVNRARLASAGREHEVCAHLAVAACLEALGRLAEAKQHSETALAGALHFAESTPTPNRRLEDLAAAHSKLGDIAQAEGRRPDGRRHYEIALEMRRTLVDIAVAGDAVPCGYLCATLNNLALLEVADGQSGIASAYYQEVIAVLRRMSAGTPHWVEYRQGLFCALNNAGELAKVVGEQVQGHEFLAEAHAIAVALATEDPSRADLQTNLSTSHGSLGDEADADGRTEEAWTHLRSACAIQRELCLREPARVDLQCSLAAACTRLGRLTESLGRMAEAEALYEESLTIARRLAQQEPEREDFQRDLAVSYSILGNVSLNLGQVDKARSYYEADLAIALALGAARPGQADLQHDIAVSWNNIGDLAATEGDQPTAHRCYLHELAIRRWLHDVAPNPTTSGGSWARPSTAESLACVLRSLATVSDAADEVALLAEAESLVGHTQPRD